MKQSALIAMLGSAAALAVGGCTPTPTATSFSQGEANTVMSVQFGTITSVMPVDIRPGQTRVGTVAGAIIGGVAGSQIGSSTAANVAGGVAGATAGGAVGSAMQGSARSNGVELTLQLDSGQSVAVVQRGHANDWRVGDRVRLTGSAENARVTR